MVEKLDNVSDKWFRAEISKKDLKLLSKKSDLKGLQHVTLYFILLFFFGYMSIATWGTWWTILWLWLYGVLFYASNPIWHECGHRTAFKSKYLNEIFYQIGSFMTDFEPTRWTWSHFRHHSNTASVADPHDYEAALFHQYPSLQSFLFSFVPFAELIKFKDSWKFETIKHAMGLTTPVMRDCIPQNEIWKCRLISRIHVAIWIASFLMSLYFMNPLPALLIFFPRYWGNIIELFNQTQHIGLPEDVKDHRYTTRSVRFNPIFSFLYWHMEYHVEHHMFPSVPSYNLPKLSNLIKDQLPKANSSLFDAYKEIIPAIIKQHKDNNYFIQKEVPNI